MDQVAWVVWGVAVASVTFVVVLVLVFTRAATRRPEPLLGPRPAAPTRAADGTVVPPRPGAVDGTWNAMQPGPGLIGAMGGTATAAFGRIDLTAGTVSFTRHGRDEADWIHPCTGVRVRLLSLATAQGDIELAGPMGTVRLTVSREHVNRVTRNGFKTVREHGYAREVVQALWSQGAVHG